jgi:hypothetical protein
VCNGPEGKKPLWLSMWQALPCKAKTHRGGTRSADECLSCVISNEELLLACFTQRLLLSAISNTLVP